MTGEGLRCSEERRRQRRLVWAGLGVAIVLDTVVQLLWKQTVMTAEGNELDVLWGTVRRPLFHLVVALYLIQFVNWMTVLGKADVSYVQPITALSYITVALASYLFLGEHIPPQRMIGMALILAGVWFISRTHHRTTPAREGCARHGTGATDYRSVTTDHRFSAASAGDRTSGMTKGRT